MEIVLLILTVLALLYCLAYVVVAVYTKNKLQAKYPGQQIEVTVAWYPFALPVILAAVTAMVHYVSG